MTLTHQHETDTCHSIHSLSFIKLLSMTTRQCCVSCRCLWLTKETADEQVKPISTLQ